MMNENHINSASTATIGRGPRKRRPKVPGNYNHNHLNLHHISFPVSDYPYPFLNENGVETRHNRKV